MTLTRISTLIDRYFQKQWEKSMHKYCSYCGLFMMLWTHANLPMTFVRFPYYYFFLWNKLNNIFRYLMFAFISHAWNKTMQGDFKSYFSIYGNRLLLIIVVDTPIIPKDDNVIQPIGILHRHLTYWSIFCVCRRRIKQKSFD